MNGVSVTTTKISDTRKITYLYVATDKGVCYSTDGGRTFKKSIDESLKTTWVKTNAVFSSDNDRYVFATTRNELLVSDNYGYDFTARSEGLPTPVYAACKGRGFYVATAGGLGISKDDGYTMRTTANGLGSNQVQWVYAVGSTLFAATTSGLSISTDGGTTFTNYTTADGLGSNDVRGVHVVGNTVYVATYGRYSSAGGVSRATLVSTPQ